MKNLIYYRNKEAIAIIRMSHMKQGDGLSSKAQEDEITRYCKKLGLNLKQVFTIIESAKDSKSRIKYKEAIRFAEKNKIGNIVFYMFDRESRNFTDLEENEDKVLDGVFNIHYGKENIILHKESTDADLLTRAFSGIINKQFIRNLKTKVNDGMKAKAESGWYPSNSPAAGYVCAPAIDPETGRHKKRGGIITPDPDEKVRMSVIREYELRAQGYSLERIREQVISEGLVSRRRMSGYTKAAIFERLKNHFYRGSFMWQGVMYKGKHELFIPFSLIQKVDETLGLRGSYLKKEEDDQLALMGGWLKCSCGCHIVYDPKKKINPKTKECRTYHYYHCTNGKKAHESLKGMIVTEDVIWVQLSAAVDDIHISPDFAKDIADALNKLESKAHSATRKQVEELRIQESEFQARENKLLDMLLDGRIDQDTFDFQLKRVRSERSVVYNQIEQLQLILNSQVLETTKSVLELAKNAKLFWNSQSQVEKKKVLDMILSNPILDGSNIRFDLRKPFEILKEMKGNKEWCARQDSNL